MLPAALPRRFGDFGDAEAISFDDKVAYDFGSGIADPADG